MAVKPIDMLEICRTVNDRRDLTLEEAKVEYLQLKARLNDGTKWVAGIEIAANTRLNFLKTLITDIICGEKK